VIIWVCNYDHEKAEKLKEELKAKANMLYLVDHIEKTKEVYQEYARPSASWFVG